MSRASDRPGRGKGSHSEDEGGATVRELGPMDADEAATVRALSPIFHEDAVNVGGLGSVAENDVVNASLTSSMAEGHLGRGGSPVSLPPATFQRLENLIGRGDWAGVLAALEQDTGGSPTSILLEVIARREASREDASSKGIEQAIGAVAQLLHLPQDSAIALLLAKRMLRRQTRWEQEQPSAALSVVTMLVGWGAAAGIGWLVSRLVY